MSAKQLSTFLDRGIVIMVVTSNHEGREFALRVGNVGVGMVPDLVVVNH